MVNPEVVKRVQAKKAEIVAQMVFPQIAEDDTSAEIKELVELTTTDLEVADQAMVLLEEMLVVEGVIMYEDPGHEAAEEQLASAEDEYYSDLADSES